MATLAAVLSGLAASSTLLTWSTGAPLAAVTAPGPAAFEDLLALSAAGAAWLVLAWLSTGLLVTLLSLVAARRRRVGLLDRLSRRIAPRAVRQVAALLLGAGLVGAPIALALPAQAQRSVAPATACPGPVASSQPTSSLDRWTPDRPVAATPSRGPAGGPLAQVASRPHRERVVDDHVVVRRGDTLWDIAARALGRGASAADVAASWPRWHAANRSTIGPDPDLIRPGQLLRPPGS